MSDWLPPPRTGEFTLRSLSTYNNPWVNAVAQHLMRPPFLYRPDDRMTGELVTRLVQFVDFRNGRTDASRIRPGSNMTESGFRQATGLFFFPPRSWETDTNDPFLIGLSGVRYNRRRPFVSTSYGRVLFATHTVRRGESLSTIAQIYYGDGRQWRRIYEENRERIRDPNLIRPGQDLLISNPTTLHL